MFFFHNRALSISEITSIKKTLIDKTLKDVSHTHDLTFRFNPTQIVVTWSPSNFRRYYVIKTNTVTFGDKSSNRNN